MKRWILSIVTTVLIAAIFIYGGISKGDTSAEAASGTVTLNLKYFYMANHRCNVTVESGEQAVDASGSPVGSRDDNGSITSLTFNKTKDIRLWITPEQGTIKVSGSVLTNQSYDEQGYSVVTTRTGGFRFQVYTNGIEIIGESDVVSDATISIFVSNLPLDASISTRLESDETRESIKKSSSYNYAKKTVTPHSSETKSDKWANVKARISALEDTIYLITNMYLGIGIFISLLSMMFNFAALAASPSHPMLRVKTYINLACCAGCIAALGGTWKIARLIVSILTIN